MGNLGAFIRFGAECKPEFTTFSAAPHPDVRAMKYAPMMNSMMMQ
jgi:serine/threonine-protein phosphatase 5